MIYAFTENFLLPFSHDEVVHGKGSMLNKMPGDEWQRFANLRLLYTYMFTRPGKKLLFMGTEFAQGTEWKATGVLDWYVLDYAYHQGVQRLVKDLNRLYKAQQALHQYDFDPRGFEWIDCNDAQNSVLVYQRKADDGEVAVMALNFTPMPRTDYRIGVPKAGAYLELFNSDSEYYGGSNMGNGPGMLLAEEKDWMNNPYSITITLPPLAGIILKSEGVVRAESTDVSATAIAPKPEADKNSENQGIEMEAIDTGMETVPEAPKTEPNKDMENQEIEMEAIEAAMAWLEQRGLVDQRILHRGNPQVARPAAGLGHIHRAHRRRRRGHAHLHGDISDDQRGHLRLHPVDGY